MNIKDFFISYNKENKDWAKWIAGTLEEHGYTVYLQAWDIAPGDDFIQSMNNFLENSRNYIAVLSSDFWNSEYCKKEFQTAFNAHIKNQIQIFLPIRIEDVHIDTLYQTTVYVDLFNVDESTATEKLLNGVRYKENPRKKGKFPGTIHYNSEKIVKGGFPGNNHLNYNNHIIHNVKFRDIIILEMDKNKKGDLFNRLVSDLFHGLGFGDPDFNVPKTGREIDIILKHRTENRIAIVESKAQSDKVGGSDINKFIGVLDLEKDRYTKEGNSVIGYFISQSGFTTAAIEQEEERARLKTGKRDLILLGPDNIINELIQGKILCPLEKAIESIGKVQDKSLFLCNNADLIASEQGWMWVLYYSQYPQQIATHFALVYADGNQVLNEIADVVIEKCASEKYLFSKLSYIKAPLIDEPDTQSAQDAYYKYLASELGEIQFEGMPTDKEAGAVKVNLESIYVPLRFYYEVQNEEGIKYKQTNINGVINWGLKAAILAKPGGGKSTLVRRIALALAYPERRKMVDDELPELDCFPVYIRCRDLGESATKSILDIIGEIVYRAEITKYKKPFNRLIDENLQNGKLFVLIDGLDEISNEKNRICFVSQLRTFVATYPTVHLLITSRKAGFRAVADTIASYCQQFSISNFETKEIRLLSLKWHQAILGESGQAEVESDKVCNIILNDLRIIALAENPLLLTTLLFVKRWVGYLPTKKCRLYEEMIKLLLVTWNAAGHDKLDMDESEPQLAFVAYCMTKLGAQKITREKLEKIIIDARKALPEILGYTTISASKFIDQVEERSSLLIQSGLEEDENGRLVPSYEFSHLSFQEYLTAKAIATSWIPEEDEGNLLDVLKPHLHEDHWNEVVPLAAVISGRQAKSLVEYLIDLGKTELVQSEDEQVDHKKKVAAFHLANCIASEVPMSQELLNESLNYIVIEKNSIRRIERRPNSYHTNVFTTIIESKYGKNYVEIVENGLFNQPNVDYLYQYTDSFLDICISKNKNYDDLKKIRKLLNSEDSKDNVTGALYMMNVAFRYSGEQKNKKIITNIFYCISQLLQKDDPLSIFVASWCIAWSGYNESNIIPDNLTSKIANKLVSLWTGISAPHAVKRVISWAMYSVVKPKLQIDEVHRLNVAIEEIYSRPSNEFDRIAAVHLAVLNEYWSKDKIKKRLNEIKENSFSYGCNSRFLIESGFSTEKELQEVF